MPILVALALAPILGTVLVWVFWAVVIVWILQQWWFWATLISSVLCFVVWVISETVRTKKRAMTVVFVGIVICVFGISYLIGKSSQYVLPVRGGAPQAQFNLVE